VGLDFLRRLLLTIPPRRMNMVRFHGVFAPRAKVRPMLQTLLPAHPKEKAAAETDESSAPQPEPLSEQAEAKGKKRLSPRYRRPWHELLKRVFDLSVLNCPRCGHRMHRISHIEQPLVIARILDHLGLPTEQPPLAPARAPPQLDLLDLDECEIVAAEVF